MADCTQCADYEWCAKNEECAMFKPKTMTNYDRLRAMSVEEMAEFMKSSGASCPDGHFVGDYDCKDCKNCWLGWLREEDE